MFPNLSRNDRVDGSGRNSVLLGERGHASILARDISGANLSDDSLVYNYHRVLGAFKRSALLNHIRTVICGRSKKHVVRVYARGIVAFVAYLKTIRNRSIVLNPTDLMSAPDSRFPVSVLTCRPSPQPTVARLIDTSPETRNCAKPVVRVITTLRTVVIGIARPSIKDNAASLTGVWYFRFSQDVNLRDRFAIWLGSFTVQPVFGPFVF